MIHKLVIIYKLDATSWLYDLSETILNTDKSAEWDITHHVRTLAFRCLRISLFQQISIEIYGWEITALTQ